MALNQNNLKQTPIPVVNRQVKIVNGDGTVTRSGQLLLEQLQAPPNLIAYGAAGKADAGMLDGAIYVVNSGGAGGTEVIYQLQAGEWHYIAGTMWGTLSPDQRPVGLGANDAGFQFRTIDSDPRYGGREFIWSGSIWVEVTPVRYGTHADRLALVPSNLWQGQLYVETDRSVLYQLQTNSGVSAWHYIAGTMWGTFSPDQRPTDLGANDAGFTFRTTDAPPRSFVWSGTVWVETTPAANNSALIAYGTTNPTLTTTPTDLPGCSLTLPQAGVWMVYGVIYPFIGGAGDNLQFLQAQLALNGAAQAGGMSFAGPTGAAATVAQQWKVTVSAGAVVKLQGFKSGGTGTSQIFGTNTSISATWVSP